MTTQSAPTYQPRTTSRSDGLHRFIQAGAWAAIVSGVALVVSSLLEWLVVPFEELGDARAYLTGSYLASSSLRLVSTIVLLWGLLGLYRRQSRTAGAFGLWAFIVAFFGAALQAGNVWAEVFVWPTLAQVAPDVVTGQVTDTTSYLVTGVSLSGPLLGLGLVLFGVSMVRTRLYPRWASVLLIISIPVTILLPPTSGTFDEAIGQIVLGVALVALGSHARGPGSHETPTDTPRLD